MPAEYQGRFCSQHTSQCNCRSAQLLTSALPFPLELFKGQQPAALFYSSHSFLYLTKCWAHSRCSGNICGVAWNEPSHALTIGACHVGSHLSHSAPSHGDEIEPSLEAAAARFLSHSAGKETCLAQSRNGETIRSEVMKLAIK